MDMRGPLLPKSETHVQPPLSLAEPVVTPVRVPLSVWQQALRFGAAPSSSDSDEHFSHPLRPSVQDAVRRILHKTKRPETAEAAKGWLDLYLSLGTGFEKAHFRRIIKMLRSRKGTKVHPAHLKAALYPLQQAIQKEKQAGRLDPDMSPMIFRYILGVYINYCQQPPALLMRDPNEAGEYFSALHRIWHQFKSSYGPSDAEEIPDSDDAIDAFSNHVLKDRRMPLEELNIVTDNLQAMAEQLPSDFKLLRNILGWSKWDKKHPLFHYLDGAGTMLGSIPPQLHPKIPTLERLATLYRQGGYEKSFPSLVQAVLKTEIQLRAFSEFSTEDRPAGDLLLMTMMGPGVRSAGDLVSFINHFNRIASENRGDLDKRLELLTALSMGSYISTTRAEALTPLAAQYVKATGDLDGVLLFLETAPCKDMPIKAQLAVWERLIPMALSSENPHQTLIQAAQIVNFIWRPLVERPALIVAAVQQLLKSPSTWENAAQMFSMAFTPTSLAEEGLLKNLGALQQNLKLFTLVDQPEAFFQYYLQNQETLSPLTLANVYRFIDVDHSGVSIGKALLPELLALLRPHIQAVEDRENRKELIEYSSQALTRIYRYLVKTDENPVPQILPAVMQTWMDVGGIGLGFSKWRLDAMKLWKAQGPMEKPPLLVQSGLFQPIVPRQDDATYHGGFLHYDEETGLSIELRRSYVVISKRDAGTLVVRNSSHYFGRDLLEEPAYYHSFREYSQGADLFTPNQDLKTPFMDERFYCVLEKGLNRTKEEQRQNHARIQELIESFDGVMARYNHWKSGYENGKPLPGLLQMLELSAQSAQGAGGNSPFGGAAKNVRLSWVYPYGVPVVQQSFDPAQPGNLAELQFYLNVVQKRQRVINAEEYQEKMPNLLGFLQFGMSNGYELILT